MFTTFSKSNHPMLCDHDPFTGRMWGSLCPTSPVFFSEEHSHCKALLMLNYALHLCRQLRVLALSVLPFAEWQILLLQSEPRKLRLCFHTMTTYVNKQGSNKVLIFISVACHVFMWGRKMEIRRKYGLCESVDCMRVTLCPHTQSAVWPEWIYFLLKGSDVLFPHGSFPTASLVLG